MPLRSRYALTVVVLAALGALLAPLPLLAASTQGTRVELRRLRARIATLARQDSRDAAEGDRLTAQLRAAELSLSGARAALAGIDAEIAKQGARRAVLAATRAQQALALQGARSALAQQLRVAYQVRRAGALELLLDQSNPLASARLMTYYGYFSRAQAARITLLRTQLQQLDTLDAALAQQQASLAGLQRLQQGQLQTLSVAHVQRQRALAGLTLRVRTRQQQLAQLGGQQTVLAHLLTQLSHAASSEPSAALADLHSAFGRLRGQLAWPVSGRVMDEFGQQRPSGVPWGGIVIATRRDTPVHAVSAGHVVYADWLPGLGLLVILDHGDGYLSLYGHNDRLYKAVGASVRAGDVIAAAGDTGGRPDPQLYFEIRQGGRPVDPLPWFRMRSPPP